MFAGHNISGSMKSWRDQQPRKWEKPWMVCALLLVLVCWSCHGPGDWLIDWLFSLWRPRIWSEGDQWGMYGGQSGAGINFFLSTSFFSDQLSFHQCNIFIFTQTVFVVIQYFIVTLFQILYYTAIQIEIVKGKSTALWIETCEVLIHKPSAFCNLITDNIAK